MKTPSASNNQFGITCSFPGLCSYCHSEVANFNGSREVMPGVFRPVITSLRADYRESTFTLDDGKKIVIVLCESCDDDIEPRHMADLMESEINGWQKEVDELLPDWTPKLKSEYMESHSKKFINGRQNRPWTIGQLSKLTKPRERVKIKVKGK